MSYDDAMRALEQGELSVAPEYTENSGLFNIGPRRDWLYSKKLFSSPAELKTALETLVRQGAALTARDLE